MSSRAFAAALAISVGLLSDLARSADQPATKPSVTITVHVDRDGVKVSSTLYGVFFEEINRAAEGGLYAELVQNRSFEDSPGLSAWTLAKNNDADGSIAIDTAQPLNSSNPHSLQLESTRGRVGAANEGFAGIPIRARKEYVLSLYARAKDGFAGPLNVSLENSVGRVLASAKIENVTSQWQKFSCALKAGEPDSDPAAR